MPAPIPVRYTGLDHLVLKVSDVARTVAFYRDVLGLQVERILTTIGVHHVRCGANLIDLIPLAPGDTLPPPAARGLEHFCIAVEGNLEDLLASLARHEVKVVLGPMEVYGARGFGTSVYIEDPDGYQIELKLNYAVKPVVHPTPPK